MARTIPVSTMARPLAVCAASRLIWGYEQDIRENPDGKDLNREFNAPHPPAEIRFVHAKLQQPFDLVIDLHDDRDSLGYYLYQNVDAEAEAVGHQILDRWGRSRVLT